jgi:TonB-linked SusC/RagA family outer membrane protein
MRNKTTLFMVFVFALCANLAFGQATTVSGIVKSVDSGEPLPGVAVVEKGTNNGTVTDFEGKFDLRVSSADAVLVFSSMGMQSKEVKASASFMVVNLNLETAQLDEVVITALGISREKKSLGYAVGNLDDEELKRSGEVDVVNSLNAKVPGVQVISSGGTPGASSKILIRGSATFTGNNQPLIVIDGIPIDNSTTQSSPRDYPFNPNLQGVNNSNRAIDINPDDIESVTVLKGPAAAALYGERAGNGAIIYTTKRGGRGGKKGLGVRVSSSVELTQVNRLPEKNEKYGSGTDGVTPGTFADPGPDGLFFTADDVSAGVNQSWGPTSAQSGRRFYDPYDFFETGVGWRNNIEVTGGNDFSTFRVGVGDLRQTGVVPNSEFNRTSVRLTADAKLSNTVKVGGTVNYVNSSQVAVQNGSNLAGIMLGLLRTPVDFDLNPGSGDAAYWQSLGSPFGSRGGYFNPAGFQRSYFYVYDNPYYTAQENPFTSNVNRVLGNVFLDWNIIEGLNFVYRLGTDVYGDNRKQIFAVSSFGDDIGGVGQINENRLSSTELYGDAILNYNRDVTDLININVRLGHNFRIRRFNDLFGRGRTLAIPEFYNLNNASDLYSSQFEEQIRSQAIFGEIAVDLGGWLYLTFTGRNEWSSTFETDNNSFFFPSASASFVFSDLVELPEWFSFGKIRYGYSQVGISPQPYATRSIYVTPTYTDGFTNGLTFPYNGVNGFSLSNTLFGAQALEPERVTANEVGVNLNFLKNLIDVDYTYYNQKSTDLLLFLPTAPSSGFGSSYTNSGEVVNQGHEVLLTINAIRADEPGDFTWSLTANWSKNISEVKALAPGVDEVSIEAAFASIGSFAIVGEPLGVFYGTQWERQNGQLVIQDNGLPKIAANTGNVGNPIPNWLAGLRNTFEWNNFTLSFLFDFRNGGDIWNGTYARMHNLGVSGASEDRERTFVIPGIKESDGSQNDIAISARTYWRSYKGDAGGASEEFVETVDWVRLRDLSLAYRFDWSKKNWGIQYLDLTFTGRNLWLSTNYNGVDPETSLTGAGSNINGFDYFNNPGTRSYIFGLSFGF